MRFKEEAGRETNTQVRGKLSTGVQTDGDRTNDTAATIW